MIRLRPLTGATDDVVVFHRGLSNLIGYSLPDERISPSHFKPPTSDDVSNAAGAHLLWQAARLTLRDGAPPLRSLGRISITPRIYQFVPLLMALRLDPVRLSIADDVGVGKTIEALLIARELFGRGEIRRMAVLCLPYLCGQWQKELSEKFNLDAVIINSGTISRLEWNKIGTNSLYPPILFRLQALTFSKVSATVTNFCSTAPSLSLLTSRKGQKGSGLESLALLLQPLCYYLLTVA